MTAPAEMPGGRSVWEVANQLGGYIGPNTPDDLVAFLSRESDAAAALAERIVSLESRALAAEAALAAERERCIAIVDAQVPDWVKERSGPYWEGYRDAMEDAAEDMRKGSTPRAAAIRAGE